MCRPTAGRRLAFTALFDNITWGVEQSADLAEEQVRLLGSHLGFVSARPEKEDRDGGPDNLWDLSAKLNAVIELKTEISRPDPVIIKSEAGQLGHSIVWDQERNPHVETHVPVLLHPSARLAVDAHLPDGARVITAEQLDHLNRDVLAFASDLAGCHCLVRACGCGGGVATPPADRRTDNPAPQHRPDQGATTGVTAAIEATIQTVFRAGIRRVALCARSDRT